MRHGNSLKKLISLINNNWCYQYFVRTNVVKLSEHGDILQTWKQYFCDLQSMNVRPEELVSENIIFNNVEVPPPTYHEVNQVIEKLKTYKAAGTYNIPAELLNQGGTELK
jgi:hypothetical protein